ncbi:MAG: gluconate 2-dehydrogenase gamma chain [Rhodothermales bacterium]|jgi:gluconate 2-dehydrogenase gamma chain
MPRREFLRRITAAGLASQLPLFLSTANFACSPGAAELGWQRFSEDEAQMMDAVTARLIPSGDSPGAREAGVVRFIDLALDRVPMLAGADGLFRDGMDDLNRRSAGGRFMDLSEEAQDAVLRGAEEEEYFGLMLFVTHAGYLGHPKHGGNRDKVSWAHIGFDDRGAWQHPFGYYDAQEGA